MNTTDLPGSSLLAGRYRLVERLGAGGMSVVWRGFDEVLGRQVAVKVLPPSTSADPSFRRRLRAEAQAAARLSHPHITNVYDYGEATTVDGEPVPYVVMELVDGESLAAVLARTRRLPWPTAVRITAEVSAALAAAHARGIVHRDVTPSNVMLTATGAKVVDFGISALIGESDIDPDGSLLGTPAYLAPERLEGGQVSPATDVYAVGLLIYRTLIGELPWDVGTTTALLRAHQYTEPDPLPPVKGLPDAVADLVERCLRKRPADRPATAELAETLARAAAASATRGILPEHKDRGEETVLLPGSRRSAPIPHRNAPAPHRDAPVSPAPGTPVPVPVADVQAAVAGMPVSDPARTYPPHAGSASAPHFGNASPPHAGSASAPHAGSASGPHAGSASAPHFGNASPPPAGGGSAPQAGNASAPQAGNASAPQAGNASAPQAGNASAPQAGNASAPQAGGASALRSGTPSDSAKIPGSNPGTSDDGRGAPATASGAASPPPPPPGGSRPAASASRPGRGSTNGRRMLIVAGAVALLGAASYSWSLAANDNVDTVRAQLQPTAAASTGKCVVSYAVFSEADKRFKASVTVANRRAQPIKSWNLWFIMQGDQVLNGNGKVKLDQQGRAVTVRGPATLGPHKTTTMEITGRYERSNAAPMVFQLGNQDCEAYVSSAPGEPSRPVVRGPNGQVKLGPPAKPDPDQGIAIGPGGVVVLVPGPTKPTNPGTNPTTTGNPTTPVDPTTPVNPTTPGGSDTSTPTDTASPTSTRTDDPVLCVIEEVPGCIDSDGEPWFPPPPEETPTGSKPPPPPDSPPPNGSGDGGSGDEDEDGETATG